MENKDRLVVMSKDSEGNNFSLFSDFSFHSYLADSTWPCEIGIEEVTPELEEQGYTEEDLCEDVVHYLVLWPTN